MQNRGLAKLDGFFVNQLPITRKRGVQLHIFLFAQESPRESICPETSDLSDASRAGCQVPVLRVWAIVSDHPASKFPLTVLGSSE